MEGISRVQQDKRNTEENVDNQQDSSTANGQSDNRGSYRQQKDKGKYRRARLQRGKEKMEEGVSTTEVHTERHTTAKVTFEGHIE